MTHSCLLTAGNSIEYFSRHYDLVTPATTEQHNVTTITLTLHDDDDDDDDDNHHHHHHHREVCLTIGPQTPLKRLLTATDKKKLKFHSNIEFVGRSTNSVCDLKSSKLIMYKEIIAVYSEGHTQNVNTLCGQKCEILNFKAVVT